MSILLYNLQCVLFYLKEYLFFLQFIGTYNSSIGTLYEQLTEINIHILYMKNERGDKSNSSNSDMCLD